MMLSSISCIAGSKIFLECLCRYADLRRSGCLSMQKESSPGGSTSITLFFSKGIRSEGANLDVGRGN